jgi:hypothetical protein
MRKESPLEYVEKHKEGVNEEKLEAAIKKLAEPIGGIEYKDSDEVALENGPFALDFKYDGLEKDSSAIPVARGLALKPEQLREIKELHLSRSDRGKRLSLSDVIPGNFRVLFAPNSREKWSDFANLTEKTIVLNGDVAAPSTLLALLHEAGHVHASPKEGADSFAPEPNQDRRTVNAVDVAKKLLNERDAWAYALRTIKPFLDQEKGEQFSITKDDALVFAKGECLKSYNDWAQGQIGTMSGMHQFAMDIWDDFEREEYNENLNS